MRKHGWQLPYHPLQVVAVAVFLTLGFAFYVFFVPFVGKKILQYVVTGIYSILVTCVFSLYIWCAAADPADPGVFKSKKYIHYPENEKHTRLKDSKVGGEWSSSIHHANASPPGEKSLDKDLMDTDVALNDSATETDKNTCAYICNSCSTREESSEQQSSEDGMFYCSLCEVEVFKYSKHCRVCDKCVNQFDHHCRWLNNCVGKRNYQKFFTLMISSLLLLILQWSIGMLVLISCFLERKRFSVDIASKLGSSFTLVPFVIVVALCTILAMIATLPLAQLFFFHILLVKKGISTYAYIIALREQDQEQQGVGGQQSQQMSPASSLTGLSSTGSFTTFRRGAWCTPPRLFLEDQFDVVPPETGSVSSLGRKMAGEEPIKKKNSGAVKISPWALARLNAEEVSKAAAEARKKSRIMQPVVRRDAPFVLEANDSFGSSDRRKRGNQRIRLPADLSIDQLMTLSAKFGDRSFTDTSTSLAPLQLEARSAFQTSRAITSSPESSIDSTDIHSFRVSTSGAEDARQLTGPSAGHDGIPLSRSTSDGYDASGGEDSDRVPSRIVQRSTYWSNLNASSSFSHANIRKL